MQFGSGMPDEQENKQYTLAGRGDVRPFGRAGPAAEFLFQLMQLQRVQTVVRSGHDAAVVGRAGHIHSPMMSPFRPGCKSRKKEFRNGPFSGALPGVH